jgi:C-terminal processing protease CtpA/Prc
MTIFRSIRSNDRIVNVNGHPVVRHMEHTALKLIRESTDFVNLVNEYLF